MLIRSHTKIGILQKHHTQDAIWHFVNNSGKSSLGPNEITGKNITILIY